MREYIGTGDLIILLEMNVKAVICIQIAVFQINSPEPKDKE